MQKPNIFVNGLFLMALMILPLNLVKAQTNFSDSRNKGQKATAEEFQQKVEKSVAFLESEIQLNQADSDFQVLSVEIDKTGMSHTKFLQTIKGIPVWGSEAIVHLNSDDSLFTITNDLKPLKDTDVNINTSEKEATDIAFQQIECEKCEIQLSKQPDLWIFPFAKQNLAVYRVELETTENSITSEMPVLFINASNGKVVFRYDNLQRQSAIGSGQSNYTPGTLTFPTFRFGSTYYLEDPIKKIGVFKYGDQWTIAATDADNIWNTAAQKAEVDAHYGAIKTFEYYSTKFGRNGLDGRGGPGYFASANGTSSLFSLVVHYTNGPNTAFWNGRYAYFGDGNSSNLMSLTSLDRVGHELTHAVIQYSANLAYYGESGALNEAIADVFGAMVERSVQGESINTWRIGEQYYTPSIANDAPRFLDNPHQAPNMGWTADDFPDHWSERRFQFTYGAEVDINAGIPGKAFYLLAKGGKHHLGGAMPGIGADQAAQIWYKALTSYMTSSTNFVGARTATINAANQLFGANSFQAKATAYSWTLVGVGTSPCAGNSKLSSGQYLSKGQSLTSCSGFVSLTFQTDGNIVLKRYDGVVLWQTGTAGRTNATQFLMRSDGVLVLYAGSTALWYTRTFNYPGATAILQDDMNFVIYSTSGNVLWNTGTAIP